MIKFNHFIQFKVFKKQLRASKAQISCPKRLLNQEIDYKQKSVKLLQQKVIRVKNSLNCKMSYIDYVHACNTFFLSNNKNSSEVKGGFPLLNSLAKKIRAKFFREKKFQAHMFT